MATLDYFTNFSHSIAAACGGSTVATTAQLWDVVTGTPSIETSTVHHGATAMRFQPDGVTAQFVQITLPTGQRRRVASAFVYFTTLPTGAGCRIIGVQAANALFVGVNTSGNWFAQASGGTAQTGPAASTGQWYLVEFDADTSADPHVLKWRINGVAQTNATGTAAAVDIGSFRMGATLTTSTANFVIGCAATSATGADYPLGEYKILGYKPNADDDITQVGSGAFVTAGGSAISGGTPAWNNLLSPGDATAANRVEQTAIDAAGYIKVGFENSGESTDPASVIAIAALRADSTTGTNGHVQVDDGGTLDTFTTLIDPSESTNVNIWKCLPVRPNGGTAWTDSAFDALAMRFGYSTDANPDVWFVGLMFEAAFAVVAATGNPAARLPLLGVG